MTIVLKMTGLLERKTTTMFRYIFVQYLRSGVKPFKFHSRFLLNLKKSNVFSPGSKVIPQSCLPPQKFKLVYFTFFRIEMILKADSTMLEKDTSWTSSAIMTSYIKLASKSNFKTCISTVILTIRSHLAKYCLPLQRNLIDSWKESFFKRKYGFPI